MAKTTDTNGPFRGLYLHWEGKKIYRQSIPTPRIFEPIEKYSHGGDRPNMLIEGDNLQVLASLKPRYAGQVDVIYIDPPYNLGKDDFRYSDRRFHDPDADDSDAVYGALLAERVLDSPGRGCRFSWRRFGPWSSLVSHGRRCDPGVRYGGPFPLGGLLALAQIPTASTPAVEAAAAK